MVRKLIVFVLSIALMAAIVPLLPRQSVVSTAEARGFGFRAPRIFSGAVRRGARRVIVGPSRVLPFRTLRRTLGVLAVVTVGAVILSDLSKSQRREVARRTRKVAESDPEREVVDTYTTNKGRKTITITAQPSQPASAFRADAAVAPGGAGDEAKTNVAAADAPKGEDKQDAVAAAAEAGQATSVEQAANEAPAEKTAKSKKTKADNGDGDAGQLKLADLPDTTPCRRIETKLVVKGKKKDGTDSKTSSNAALLCMTDGKWQPATI